MLEGEIFDFLSHFCHIFVTFGNSNRGNTIREVSFAKTNDPIESSIITLVLGQDFHLLVLGKNVRVGDSVVKILGAVRVSG